MHINFFRRVMNSLLFRWKHFKKRQEIKILENLKNKHLIEIQKISSSNFTIISANCWGGSVYEDLKLQYLTPTVGLFFYAPCYIEFLKDLEAYMQASPEFINHSKYPEANQYRNQNYAYPIGLLNKKVEIHFLHYKTEQEALEKWERRKQRINWENLFIACTDRDRMTTELMKEFDQLPYAKKVIFTAKKYPDIKSAVQIKAYKKQMEVGDLYNERYFINITKLFKYE